MFISPSKAIDLSIHQPGAPSNGLLKLFSDQSHTDITFLVTGQPVKAHKPILASQSDYFSALLYGPMREGQASEIVLEDTPVEAFRELLKFVYSGSVATLNVMVSCMYVYTCTYCMA